MTDCISSSDHSKISSPPVFVHVTWRGVFRGAFASVLLLVGGTASAQHGPAEDSASSTAPLIRALTPNNVKVEVSVRDRRLWVISGSDTLRTAAIAVASGEVLSFGARRWRFTTPRGRLVVLAKKANPTWLPPDWHYVEVAKSHSLSLRQLPPRGVVLKDGRRLLVRDSLVGLVERESDEFLPLPVNEHVVFDQTLFIPPLATHNRQLSGALGPFALDLGDGYMLHGTRDTSSIGSASTHGCFRLTDEDITWLYDHIPVGAAVYVRN